MIRQQNEHPKCQRIALERDEDKTAYYTMTPPEQLRTGPICFVGRVTGRGIGAASIAAYLELPALIFGIRLSSNETSPKDFCNLSKNQALLLSVFGRVQISSSAQCVQIAWRELLSLPSLVFFSSAYSAWPHCLGLLTFGP